MATAEQVISDSRLRFAVGETSGILDEELSARRDAAISLIEKWTGRVIIDRPSFVTGPEDFVYFDSPEMIGFRIQDVKDGDILLKYAEADDPYAAVGIREQTFTIPTSTRCYRTQDSVVIYADPARSWLDTMRFSHPVPTLTATLGMTSIPAPFGEACALLVREMLEGSSFDEVPKRSAVSRLITPYKKSPYGAITRTMR